MNATIQFNTEELRLTPVIFKESQGGHGSIARAAFSVKLRFSFTAKIPHTVHNWATDLIPLIKEQLDLKRNDAIPSNGKLPATWGIPAAYARTYEELCEFLGFEGAPIFEPKLSTATFVFACKATDSRNASSMTLRYGVQSFQRTLQGNYRTVSFSCRAEEEQADSFILSGTLHMERGTLAMTLQSPDMLRKALNMELTHGSIEIELIMTDQRKYPTE